MEVTSVNIKAVANEAPVVAYVSIVIDESFAVRKIRILYKSESYTVHMPSMKSKDGRYSDVCHPINSKAREKIETAVLNAYLGQLKSKAV